MFDQSTVDRFTAHVRELRGDAARERAARKAAELEAKIEAIERQAIAVWRCVDGIPVEIIHRR